MSYDKQILQVLTEAGGRGIRVKSLVKHVYNMNVSLFSTPDLEDIRSYVRRFLQRNSRSEKSLIEHTPRWGCYRLNTRRNATARQLMTDFQQAKGDEAGEGEAAGPPAEDRSLNLFADMA